MVSMKAWRSHERRAFDIFSLLLCLPCGLANVCLQGGFSQSELKNVENAAEESYAIGFWVNDWSAGHLTVEVARTLIQEKLGYKVELKGPGSLTRDGFFALTGCTSPSGLDPGCGPSGPSITYTHINIEVWTDVYRGSWDEIQMKYPNMAPKNLGNLGYYGATGLYVPSAVQERAYEAEGSNLDFYRDYNVTWKNPSRYFTSPGDVNVSELLPCTDSALMLHEVMANYLNITGDTAGVVLGAAGITGKCFQEYFWLAPACRHQASSCFVWLTGGNGWGMYEVLVKATTYSMPLATAVASSFANYGKLATVYDMMLYWWVPDPTFLRLTPVRVVFPQHKPDEWAKENRRTASRDVSVEKHVSQDLNTLAPEVEEFIARLSMSMDTVEELMRDQTDTQDSYFDVACRWLRSNEAKWSDWLPEKGKCFSQFGMYDERTGTFLKTRDGVAAITCKACPSGFFSERLQDAQGVTFICKECELGSAQASGASVACEPCPFGQYANEPGSHSCKVCPVDEYQDEKGGHGCKRCPGGRGTRLLGSVSISDCGCHEGSINIAANGTQCVRCGEGLDCPFSSKLEHLTTGQVTRVKKGYYATFQEPLEILRCRPQSSCPGGAPGRCAKGLIGKVCAACPKGKTLAGHKCRNCGATAVGWAWGLLLVLILLVFGYYITNREVLSQATPFKSVIMAFTLASSALQLLAVLGLMSVKWPRTVQSGASNLKFMVLDLDSVSFSCVTGNSPMTSYLLSLALFPAAIAWLWLCYLASQYLPKRLKWRPWQLAFLLNTIGCGLVAGYGTMAAVALKPFMCYKHPNGQNSLVSYPGVFCGEGEHGLMLMSGSLLLVFFVVGFFALCAYACWNVSTWAINRQARKVQSFRFSMANFRLDAYWFILLVLLRGFFFAVCPVIGANHPPLQTALASLVLTIYGIAVTKMRPWKARVINFADTFVTFCFLLLVSKAIQVQEDMEEAFAESYTIVLLLFIVAGLTLAAAFSVVALLLEQAGARWTGLLSLGVTYQANHLAEDMQRCADFLQEIETPELANKIASLNTYDLQNLQMFIEIIFELNFGGMERNDSGARAFRTINSQMRVNQTVMNQTTNRNSLRDGHDGDGSVIGAGCSVAADDMVLKGGVDVETDEPTPSFRSDADEDITEGPGPVIVGNLVSTQL